MKAKLRWTSWNVFWVLSASRNWVHSDAADVGIQLPRCRRWPRRWSAPRGRRGPGVSRRGGVRELAGNCVQIAHTGVYDSARYGSPSQARQAVITAAVWAGMSMVDVLARISDGRWRGLASFYARYSNPTSRREALSKFDWPAAVAYVIAQKGKNPGSSLVRQSLTSRPHHTGGYPGRQDPTGTHRASSVFCGPGGRRWRSRSRIQHQLGGKSAGDGPAGRLNPPEAASPLSESRPVVEANQDWGRPTRGQVPQLLVRADQDHARSPEH